MIVFLNKALIDGDGYKIVKRITSEFGIVPPFMGVSMGAVLTIEPYEIEADASTASTGTTAGQQGDAA